MFNLGLVLDFHSQEIVGTLPLADFLRAATPPFTRPDDGPPRGKAPVIIPPPGPALATYVPVDRWQAPAVGMVPVLPRGARRGSF